MTRLLSLSPDAVRYEGEVRHASKVMPGVEYAIRRISLGRRIEFARKVREFAARLECHEAGTGILDRIDSGLITAEIDALYLRWAVSAIFGLSIDGRPASCEALIDTGPEPLAKEIAVAIRKECGLSEHEIKN
jgi:hypothetical protein